MTKKKRITAGILAAVAAVLLGNTTVMAAAQAGEPVFSIETDKTEYSSTDPINETIKIYNASDDILTDIEISGNIPEGYLTEDGISAPEQWKAQIESVDVGETRESTVRLVQKTGSEDSGLSDQQSGDRTGDTGTVQTGDTANIVPWSIAGAASLCIIIGVVAVVRKRKGRNLLSLLLVLAMAGTLLPTSMTAKAAEPGEKTAEEKTEEIEKTITIDGEEVTLKAVITYQTETKDQEQDTDLSYEGYHLKWEDQFEGNSLNRDDWNVELHDPGWVNNELQSYVDSPENIYIKDGSLVLKPVENVSEDGSVSYTSGRINTQHKHDFKYGLFEARVKVPEGQGFLPAFWMMPTDENLYGQWPRCGEIDIMEVLGNNTDTSYGTIHYGNPHSESQGSYTLDEGSFSEEYHVFDVEWEPGKISWYVDGKLIHTEDNWYSATEGQGEITYPAPFDQPFYIILNLAVGGNWPGNPDDTTDIKNSAYYIDYVKVYQKDSYDENVTKPIEEVILRDPDENGNYIINGDFSVNEELTDDKDWVFLTALGGEAGAEIRNNEIAVTTENEGTVDYSVQLVQPNLPMKQGGVYRLSFDAYADADRTMKVGISAPDRSFRRYLNDTEISLTQKKQTYNLDFTMTDSDDANGRLEFNMGAAGSTSGIRISNVSLKKTDEIVITDGEKGILADGNYVYNGSFQEGEERLGYWDVQKNDGAEVSVTNENNIRRLMVNAPEGTSADKPVIVSQSDLALSAGNTYAMSFTAEGESGREITIEAAGQEYSAKMNGTEQQYDYKLTLDAEPEDTDLAFIFKEPGLYYLDNVRIEEDSLIKNGSFNAGFSGYEPYVDSSISSDVTYVVDSLSEDNAADFTINNTGDAAWKIQLKQNNVELEKGQWYRLSLDAKASMPRELMFAIQRDGSSDDDWTPYSGEKIVELGTDYKKYEAVFQMTGETDPKALLSISMGAVGGKPITEKHRICIDNINLEKIDAPDIGEQPAGENLLVNSDFSSENEGWENVVKSPGAADVSFENGRAVYKISNVGTEDWNVQLKQNGIVLEQGAHYKVTFKAKSSEARTIKLAMLSPSYNWFGGKDLVLDKDQEEEFTVEFTMNEETETNASMVISMGAISEIDTPASTVELSEFSLIRTE
ncbi:carbohydrate binding domain-containing protein [Mediterraneibacter glycyrrhizinilyticus]|nr:carbohydrate binding domain-containing protein [Mediterraneibacter glycyrrhizinilyticus]MBM6802654.1 carbohydrate binding domain-containing protein [Mediterraneibacter glycyrrhizinilyticus]